MMGLTTAFYEEQPARRIRRRSRTSLEADNGGCFGLGICEFMRSPATEPQEQEQRRTKSYLGAMFQANRALKGLQMDDEESGEEIVRLTEQLDKLKRAIEHVSYGPAKKRLDDKIKQLQAELDEVVDTVMVG